MVGLLLLTCDIGFSQSADENTIRKLSALEVESFLESDTIALEKLWSPGDVVKNPFNKIVTFKEIKILIANAKIKQIRFERIIEKITINHDMAIEMGKEIPNAKSASAGVPKNVTSPRQHQYLPENQWLLDTYCSTSHQRCL